MGVAAGVAVILWMTLSPRLPAVLAFMRSPFHRYLTIVFGTATIVVVGLLVTGFVEAWRKRTA